MATLSEVRERDLFTFGNTLLKIAMSHPFYNLRVRTLILDRGDVRPPWACLSKYFPPVNQTLSRNYVIRQPTVTINSDDSCRVWLKVM